MKVWIFALKVLGYTWLTIVTVTILVAITGIWMLGGFSAVQELMGSIAAQEHMEPIAVQEVTGSMNAVSWVFMAVIMVISLAPGIAALALANKLKEMQSSRRQQPAILQRTPVGPAEELVAAASGRTRLAMVQKSKSWERAIDDLALHYREVERRSLSLAPISVAPFLIAMWNLIKCIFFFYADLLLFVPISLVILVRNLFPGKWSYRSFSWPYIKYAGLWISRGEAPQFPFVVVRWLVTFLLHAHFESRFRLLRRRILLADKLPQKDRSRLVARIDQLLEAWRSPQILFVVFTYGLPAAGFLLEIYRAFQPGQLPPWTGILTVFLISYALAFVVTGFIVKRGVMLGGEGRAAYFPGALESAGIYDAEKQLFESIGVMRMEFPLDILLSIAGVTLGLLLTGFWINLYESWGIPVPSESNMKIQVAVSTVVILLIGVLALYRRIRLHRA